MEANEQSSGLKSVKSGWPEIKRLDELPLDADLLIVSPGMPNDNPWLVAARASNIEVIGDVELFARINQKPVIAITGSNGKSTVTKLVSEMLQNAGIHGVMGGNIGVPVLNLLASPFDVAVLELSSFQLETTASLKASSACILNVVEDHMDRYQQFDDYVAAKQRIYQGAERLVFNRHDALTFALGSDTTSCSFGMDKPQGNDIGIDGEYIVMNQAVVCRLSDLALFGRHNLLNAMAAIALVAPFDVPVDAIVKTLANFKPLPHRCELLANTGDIRWVDDSKATNVGATVAALNGVAPMCAGKLILIAGGVGKGQDFAPLKPALEAHAAHVITFGQDGHEIAALCDDAIAVASLDEAVATAARLAQAGDCVLLSPACASQDMFRNFEHRGEVFAQLVAEVSYVH